MENVVFYVPSQGYPLAVRKRGLEPLHPLGVWLFASSIIPSFLHHASLSPGKDVMANIGESTFLGTAVRTSTARENNILLMKCANEN